MAQEIELKIETQYVIYNDPNSTEEIDITLRFIKFPGYDNVNIVVGNKEIPIDKKQLIQILEFLHEK